MSRDAEPRAQQGWGCDARDCTVVRYLGTGVPVHVHGGQHGSAWLETPEGLVAIPSDRLETVARAPSLDRALALLRDPLCGHRRTPRRPS